MTDGRYATDDPTGRSSDAPGFVSAGMQGHFSAEHSGAYFVDSSGGYPAYTSAADPAYGRYDAYGTYGASGVTAYGAASPGYSAAHSPDHGSGYSSGEWTVPAQGGGYDTGGTWDQGAYGTGGYPAYGYDGQTQWSGTGHAAVTTVTEPWNTGWDTGWDTGWGTDTGGTYGAVPAQPAQEEPRNDATWSDTAMWPAATAAWAETADAWTPDSRADAWGDLDEWVGDNRAGDDLFGARRSPAAGPDLGGADLRTTDIRGTDLAGADAGAADAADDIADTGTLPALGGTTATSSRRRRASAPGRACAPGRDEPGGGPAPKARRRVSGAPVALMGVAVMAVAAVGGVQAADTQNESDLETIAGDLGPSPLDQKLLDVRDGANDFAERASRTQTRIALEERRLEVARQAEEERLRREALRPKFALPVSQKGLSAYYGSSGARWSTTHTGIDFPVAYGTPVRAVTDGVVRTEWNSAYGNMVIVRAKDGTETWYCHLSRAKVRSGPVKAGDVIAYSGNSGNSSGPHLHLEVRPGGGDPVNPLTWLRARGLDPT